MNTYNKLVCYKNGNYIVRIYNDGTKIRFTNDDIFDASFPESIDIKITNFCDINCPMCHEDSSISGKHANLNHPILDSLKEGMELAIGGGNPLFHPELIPFLKKMKEKKIICNLTINQKHFFNNKEVLTDLIKNKLIYGLGISINDDIYLNEIISFCKENLNVVLHIIAGIIQESILTKLYNNNLKILILGYKQIGRGKLIYNKSIEEKINYLKENIMNISSHFKIISFDNLAISQLEMKNKLSKEDYENYYMGDDGLFTMYIDLVKEEYGVSSTSIKRYKLENDIEKIFSHVKEISKRSI